MSACVGVCVCVNLLPNSPHRETKNELFRRQLSVFMQRCSLPDYIVLCVIHTPSHTAKLLEARWCSGEQCCFT